MADVARFLDARGAGLAEHFGQGAAGILTQRARLLELPAPSHVSSGGACRLLRATDGWIALSLARPEDVAAIPAWLELDRTVDAADPWPIVESTVAARPVALVRERAILLGLPCAVVGEQRDRRRTITEPLGEAPARPVAGVVVVNLASLWAGPLAAFALGRAGARVITVESTGRPDGARQHPDFFDALHAGGEFVTVDLSTESGQLELRGLLGTAHVVIEGSRPRALHQVGIDARAILREGPQVWASITGYGRTGEAAQRVGFGDDASAAGRLVEWVDGTPRFAGDALADPLTGMVAAQAIVRALEAGGRHLIDVALSRVAAAVAHDW